MAFGLLSVSWPRDRIAKTGDAQLLEVLDLHFAARSFL